jgi:hypothetical protein
VAGGVWASALTSSPILMAAVKRTVAVLLDAAIVIALLALLFVTVTDGGAFAIGGVHVSVRSPDTALVVLPILVLLRAATLRWAAILGVWQATNLEADSVALCDMLSGW